MKRKKVDLTDQNLLTRINQKLDQLIAVIAVQGRSRAEQVRYLASFGYSNGDMMSMLALPKGTIDSIRAKLGKGGTNGKRETVKPSGQ